jgi:hypothetical protein
VFESSLTSDITVYCCGYYAPGSQYDALKTTCDKDGNRTSCQAWGPTDSREEGLAIVVSGTITPAAEVMGLYDSGNDSTRTFVVRDDGTGVLIDHASKGVWAFDMALAANGTLGLACYLSQSIGMGFNTHGLLLTLDPAYSMTSATQFGIDELSGTGATAISSLGDALVFTGRSLGVPVTVTPELTAEAATLTWLDVVPVDLTLTYAATNTFAFPGNIQGLEIDRNAPNFDALVYVERP